MDKQIPKITDTFLKKRPLSASSLKAFGGIDGSPKQYIHYLTKPFIDTDAFILGKATELLIYSALFPKLFKVNDKFQTYTKFAKRSDEAKAKWDKMVEDAAASKITLIEHEMFAQAQIMAQTALDTAETRYYLDRIAKNKDGKPVIQHHIKWTDKSTDLPIHGYIDFMADIDGHLVIVDIKTDKDGGPADFIKNAKYQDHIVQVGAYLTGYHKTRYLFPDFMFMVIDKSEPYDAIMMHCEPDYCQAAKDEFAHILTAFKKCKDENLWHKGRSFWSADMGYFSMPMDRWMKLKYKED